MKATIVAAILAFTARLALADASPNIGPGFKKGGAPVPRTTVRHHRRDTQRTAKFPQPPKPKPTGRPTNHLPRIRREAQRTAKFRQPPKPKPRGRPANHLPRHRRDAETETETEAEAETETETESEVEVEARAEL